MNTHVHADQITGTGLIKGKLPGVLYIISKTSKSKADLLVEDGDNILVRATPGHTLGCVTYVTGDGPDQPRPRMAFTGDAVLIHGCGRTDSGRKLTPAVQISALAVSTVEEEIVYNPCLTKDEETFKTIMENLNLSYPKMMDVAVPANMVCGLQDLTQRQNNAV